MPLQRDETVHGWPCKFYANDVVNGRHEGHSLHSEGAGRRGVVVCHQVTCRADQTRTGRGGELPTDGACEATMAAKAAAAAKQAAQLAASKQIAADRAASPRRKAAAKVEAAVHHEMIAGQKRKLAESSLRPSSNTRR